MTRIIFWGLVLVVAVGFLGFPNHSVYAQDPLPTETPTPAPTPTPNYQQGITLSTGNQLIIERRVTVGDIAIVLGLLLNAAVLLVRGFVEVPKQWLSH